MNRDGGLELPHIYDRVLNAAQNKCLCWINSLSFYYDIRFQTASCPLTKIPVIRRCHVTAMVTRIPTTAPDACARMALVDCTATRFRRVSGAVSRQNVG